ncbi:MAG: putative ABC transport system ATP-binding protein [Halioglobus sp.]|jgi:putative ABC transport system ATP-binding protein
MIEARNLDKTYHDNGKRVTVFNDLNLHCKPGEYIALMGPSGAGKTSLLQLLECLDRPNSGQYFLASEQVSHLQEKDLAQIRNRTIGFIFQTNHFVEYLDLVENVALPGLCSKRDSPAVIRARARSLLCDVGLSHRLNHLPQELSGGERQRVAIARALFNRQRLILTDEPSRNLDEESTERILTLLEGLLSPQLTLLLVTHDRNIAKRAHRALTLSDGQLQALL